MSNRNLPIEWAGYLRDLKNRHFKASYEYGKFHRYTGIPLVILAALANAGIWGVLLEVSTNYEFLIKLTLAVIGTIITVLSAVQAFLSFDKRSEMHKNAAMKYSSLGADLEIIISSEQKVTDDRLNEIKEKWNVITENAPVLPERNKLRNSVS